MFRIYLFDDWLHQSIKSSSNDLLSRKQLLLTWRFLTVCCHCFDGEFEICVQNCSNIQSVKKKPQELFFFGEFLKQFYNINVFFPLKKKIAHFPCIRAENNVKSFAFLYHHPLDNQYSSASDVE